MTPALRPAVLLACCLGLPALAQDLAPGCSSDGQPRATALLERFINADCVACWTAPSAANAARGQLALDWIVPGSRGEDAPLSAAARREGLDRLAAVAHAVPRAQASRLARRAGPALAARVANGPAFNGYMGASIELPRAGPGPWHAWLLLVEALPAGTEGSPIERHLVRNALELSWAPRRHGGPLSEMRAMNIPDGARPQRLRVVGIVEDGRGRIRAIAQSRCSPSGRKG